MGGASGNAKVRGPRQEQMRWHPNESGTEVKRVVKQPTKGSVAKNEELKQVGAPAVAVNPSKAN